MGLQAYKTVRFSIFSYLFCRFYIFIIIIQPEYTPILKQLEKNM